MNQKLKAMPDFQIIQLKNFSGGLHLARGLTNSYDKTLETLHSDTLKSAIFVCALRLFGEEKVDKSFLEAFQISSAFPFYSSPTKERTYYFFPKPELARLPFDLDKADNGIEKKLKKVRFIEKVLFERMIAGQQDLELTSQHLTGNFLTDFDFESILQADNCNQIMTTEPYQHVQISRDYGTDSTPYYVDKIYFHPNAGLYFLLEADSELITSMVISAMRLLADNGIGTDRNTGNGQFELGLDQMSLQVPENGNYQINLSLYCPKKEEIAQQFNESYYGLTKRGGYISSPAKEKHQTIRKKSIYMFTEGSLFHKYKDRKGKIVDLKPEFDGLTQSVWRDGQAIFLPFKKNKTKCNKTRYH